MEGPAILLVLIKQGDFQLSLKRRIGGDGMWTKAKICKQAEFDLRFSTAVVQMTCHSKKRCVEGRF